MTSGQFELFSVPPVDSRKPAVQLKLFPSSVTEGREHTAQAMRNMPPDRGRDQQHDVQRQLARLLVALGDNLSSKEAGDKGEHLLKENLSPEQLEQYVRHLFFEVTGGKTGKTYRIHHGRQLNIFEMDGDGKHIMGWCFLPKGGLVTGDVMLAQKIALEVYEEEALKIACRFPVTSSPLYRADMPLASNSACAPDITRLLQRAVSNRPRSRDR